MCDKIDFMPADHGDISVIFEMSKELIDRYEDLSSIDYEKVLSWVKRKIETRISEYVSVQREGQKVGFYRLCPVDGKLELDDFCILPDFRNQGIGTITLKKILSEAKMPVFLYVFTENKGALSLYSRMGFQKDRQVSETRCVLCRNA